MASLKRKYFNTNFPSLAPQAAHRRRGRLSRGQFCIRPSFDFDYLIKSVAVRASE